LGLWLVFLVLYFLAGTQFDDLAGTLFLKNLAGTPGGWDFGWYFWYCNFWQEPSFDDLAGTPFLKNLAETLVCV
jgi:hypothetical protein